MKITGLLLAAGMSDRMNQVNKLTLPFRGRSIVEVSLRNMIESSLEQIAVVLGHDHTAMTDLLRQYESDSIRLLYNQDFRTGRASSIRRGLEDLDDDTEAALFMVADKPAVSSALINQALEKFEKNRPPILGVRTPKGRGHPIIFARELFDELTRLEGESGGQRMIDQYADQVFWLDDSSEQINVNTNDDYDRLIKQDAPANISNSVETD